MADVKMDDFLLQYFMQLRFNNMPPEYRAQYDAYLKADDFNGHMKDWKKHLMHETPDHKWVENEIPNPNGTEFHLTDDEWEKLFKEFQSAFRSLAANRKKFENNIDFGIHNQKVLDFLDEYFGAGKLFDAATATPAAEIQISDMLNLLENRRDILELQLSDWGITGQGLKYNDLIKGIKDKKYNTDADFQAHVKNVASYITAYTTNPYYVNQHPELKQELGTHNYSSIRDGFDSDVIQPNKMNDFKAEYDVLLRRLFHDNKLLSQFPSDKIRTAYDTAKQYVAYDDPNSKDYVPPKRADELNIIEQLKKDVSDTYEDTLAKYIKFRGDELYFSPQAKQIVSAIHKAGAKPTDGLAGVLGKASDIKKNMRYKSPKAVAHFEWFEQTLSDLNNTMPVAFKGALSNGRKLRAIVEELIMTAVRENKIDEAKSALEVLSVIKYGYTTSKIMDALKKEEVSIFSDKGLSWNKHAGVQLVTNAMDKSIKWALMGLGYSITALGNAAWMSGSKFKGKRGRIQGAQEDWEQQNIERRNDLEAQQQSDITLRDANQQTLNDMDTHLGINDTNIDTHIQHLAVNEQRLLQKEEELQNKRQELANLPYKLNEAQQKETNLTQQINQLKTDILNARNRVTFLTSEIGRLPATDPLRATYQNELNYLNTAYMPHLTQQDKDLNKELKNTQDEIDDIQNVRPGALNRDIQRLERSVQNRQRHVNRNDLRLNTWTDAKDTVQFLSDRITKRDEVLSQWDDNNKDRYKELMAYWDMLETGRGLHTGKMYNWGGYALSAKKAQQVFDTQKQSYIDNYLAGYDYR